MMTEEEEILPERLNFVQTALPHPRKYIPYLKELIKKDHGSGEIDGFCANNGLSPGS